MERRRRYRKRSQQRHSTKQNSLVDLLEPQRVLSDITHPRAQSIFSEISTTLRSSKEITNRKSEETYYSTRESPYTTKEMGYTTVETVNCTKEWLHRSSQSPFSTKDTINMNQTSEQSFSLPKINPSAVNQPVESAKLHVSSDNFGIKLANLVSIEKCLKSFFTQYGSGAQYGTGRENMEINKYFNLIKSYADWDIAALYNDNQLKIALKSAISLQIVAVVLHWYFIKQNFFEAVCKQEVRNMLRYVYQNFLLIIDYVLRKIPQNQRNERWIKNLKILSGKYVGAKTNKKKFITMTQNSVLIAQQIHKFCSISRETKTAPIYQAAQSVSENSQTMEPSSVVKTMMDAFDGSVEVFCNELETCVSTEPDSAFVVPQQISIPYLPCKKPNDHQYTLVLDLDETLIHVNESKELEIRPYCREFLQNVSQYYELVIFTSAEKFYADIILNELDPEQDLIKHRLYKDHTKYKNDAYLKDLDNLGRDLSKTIIVDDQPANFQQHVANGIEIAPWQGNKNDRCLVKLEQILIGITSFNPEDIREGMRRYKQHVMLNQVIPIKPAPIRFIKKRDSSILNKTTIAGGRRGSCGPTLKPLKHI